MSKKVEYGKTYPVILCKQCSHADWVTEVPADEEGRPYESFQHQCTQCKTIQQVRLSEIRRAKAHPKQ